MTTFACRISRNERTGVSANAERAAALTPSVSAAVITLLRLQDAAGALRRNGTRGASEDVDRGSGVHRDIDGDIVVVDVNQIHGGYVDERLAGGDVVELRIAHLHCLRRGLVQRLLGRLGESRGSGRETEG